MLDDASPRRPEPERRISNAPRIVPIPTETPLHRWPTLDDLRRRGPREAPDAEA